MRIRNILFILFGIIAVLLFICKKQQLHIPFFSNYGNDILFIPLLCWTAELLMKRVYGSDFGLPAVYVWTTCLYTAIVFEWLVPAVTSTYTADVLDVICYVAGTVIFLLGTRRYFTFASLLAKVAAP